MALKKLNALIHDGLGELKRRLPERWVSGRDADEVAESIDGLNFPATVAFLGAREAPRDGSHRELLERSAKAVAENEEMRKLGVEAHGVEGAVSDLIRDRIPAERALGKLSRNGDLSRRIFNETVRSLALECGLPGASPEDVKKVSELLASGEFYDDIGSISGTPDLGAHSGAPRGGAGHGGRGRPGACGSGGDVGRPDGGWQVGQDPGDAPVGGLPRNADRQHNG